MRISRFKLAALGELQEALDDMQDALDELFDEIRFERDTTDREADWTERDYLSEYADSNETDPEWQQSAFEISMGMHREGMRRIWECVQRVQNLSGSEK